MTKTKSGAKKLGAMKKGCENSQFSQVAKFRNSYIAIFFLENKIIFFIFLFLFLERQNFFYL